MAVIAVNRENNMLPMLKILYTLLLSCMVAAVQAQTGLPAAGSKMPAHPRLLLLKGEEAKIVRIINANDGRKKIHTAILASCDSLISVAPVQRIQIGRRLLDKSREALRRIFYLSYAWRMTSDERYLKRGEKELLAISAFSDWNPSHFLDVAEMTMAAAIGYDWLHKGLQPASRKIIREAILNKGINASLDSNNNGWLRATNNWNQVCNAGMAYGALAIYEDEPQLAETIIKRSIQSVPVSMEVYAPEGAYPEGYSYWGYGTSFNVLLINALEKVYRQDFGLSQKPGFLASAAYMRAMIGPTGKPFNYSDAGNNAEFQAAMFWFAEKQNDPSLLWNEEKYLESVSRGKLTSDRILPAAMIWGSSISLNNIATPKETAWNGGGKNPVSLMRTSWTDPNAIYVGVKGGSPSLSHAHMDVGSFVMEANGQRWAMDFGMQQYESLESKKVNLWDMKQNSQRWQVFRYNNRVHNTLTVNDQLQNVEGKAPITGFSVRPEFMNAITDLTPLYSGVLKKASRGVAIAEENYVIITDELETSSSAASIRWTMLTPASVKIIGTNKAELTQNGKKLTLMVLGPGELIMRTWPTIPTNEYDAPNPGTMMTGYEVKMPANSKQSITVLLIPEGNEKAVKNSLTSLQKWPKD